MKILLSVSLLCLCYPKARLEGRTCFQHDNLDGRDASSMDCTFGSAYVHIGNIFEIIASITYQGGVWQLKNPNTCLGGCE